MSKNPEITLPSDYTYYKLSYKTDDYNFRIKEVNDQDSAEKWLKAYSSLSKTDWRVQRTYSCSGIFVIFKKDYRCCHFTDRRVRGIHPSKHTGCQAKISILVNRFNEKAKKPNYLAKAYPCTIRIKNPHNHSTDYAQIFAANFKHHQKRTKPKRDVIYVTKEAVEDLGWILPLPDNASEENSRCNDVDFSSDIENGDSEVYEMAGDEANTMNAEQSDAITGIREIFNRIEKGIQSNPNVFLPAANKMLQNASKFGATETGLVTAMHTFAAYSVVQRALKSKKSKTRRKKCKNSASANNPRKSNKTTANPIKPKKCNRTTVYSSNNPRPSEINYESYGRHGPVCTEIVSVQPVLQHVESFVHPNMQHIQGNVQHAQPAFTSGNYSVPYVM